MANHWVVNDQKVMIASFDDAGKASCTIGPDQMWLEVPEGVAVGNAKVSGEWPELSLVDGAADKAGPRWDAMRAARNAKLAASDWSQLSDSPLDGPTKTAWAEYRQDLRDLPAGTVDPDNVTWPAQP